MMNFLFVLVGLIAGSGLGEDKPNTTKVKEGTEQYIIYNQKGDKKTIVALLARKVEKQIVDGQAVITSTQRYDRANGGVDTDTTIMDANTLFPLAYRAQVGEQREAFVFKNGKITGTVSVKDTVKKNVEDAYDPVTYCSTPDLDFYRTLPLSRNYKAQFNFINPGFPPRVLHLEVVGEDSITLDGKAFSCWIMEGQSNGKGAKPRYWITKKDQTTLKMTFPLANGATFHKVRLMD